MFNSYPCLPKNTQFFGPIVALILSAAQMITAQGVTITLAWDANPEPEVAGYRLRYGPVSGTYTQMIDVGNVTTATVPDLSGGSVYFFAATSYNTVGVEGMSSNEVAYAAAPPRTPTPGPLIAASPATVNLTATAGGAAPPPQGVQITTSNGAPWHSFDTSPWFNARPSNGVSGDSTILTPNIQGLAAGAYSQNITFSADGLPDSVVAVTLTLFASPTPVPSPTPTDISISGHFSYCSNPGHGPIPSVTLALTGDTTVSTTSDSSGNYTLSPLASGGSYTVTPGMPARVPGSPGINTLDVMAVQRHFLGTTVIPPGCRLAAAEVNGSGGINTIDAILIQRFFLGASTGSGFVGRYQFTPASRVYPGVAGSQTSQNFDALIFGDVAPPFVDRMDNAPLTPTTVAKIALPEVAVDHFVTNFIAKVTTTTIDPADNLAGFQGDFTFDERVVSFQSEPVQNAGLTSGNWNVSANVLPGLGPIRTLRISAFSKDFTPLSGSGTLFNLNMVNVNGSPGASTALTWAAGLDQFIFIDADLDMEVPINATSGSVSLEPNP